MLKSMHDFIGKVYLMDSLSSADLQETASIMFQIHILLSTFQILNLNLLKSAGEVISEVKILTVWCFLLSSFFCGLISEPRLWKHIATFVGAQTLRETWGGNDCVRKAMRINWRNCSLDWTWCLLPELWSEAYTTQRQGWLFEGGRANQKANCFDYSSPMSWACQCTQVNVWILHLHTTMAGSCILPIHTLLESKLKQVV